MTDIVTFGRDKPPWRPSRRLVVMAVVVLLAVVAAGAAVLARSGRRGPASAPTVLSPAAPLCPPGSAPPPAVGVPAALIFDCADSSGMEFRDRTAATDGPWTVVVRRVGGSLGRQGAVVTFPVGAPPAGARRVGVGGGPGWAGAGQVTWPAAGAYARIRGDLAESELVAIAAATSVVAGRPAVNPPAGYAVAGGGPYRPAAVHEVRYGSAELGEQAALGGGLTLTAVAVRGGGIEDVLYAVHAEPAGLVRGRPAVVSPAFGGNGAILWEPAPDVVAYVAYSGAAMTAQAVAALHRLAARTRPLTDAQWRALTPATVDQTNDPG